MLQRYITRNGNPTTVRLQESSYRNLMQKLSMPAQEYEPEPATQLQSFPYPEPEFAPKEQVPPPALEYEYTTIRCNYNYEETHKQDIHQYMIIHTGVVDLARLTAAPTPRRVSNFISFPALPPSPCRSPVNLPKSASKTSLCDENSSLLPTPVTSARSGRRLKEWDFRRAWLGVMIVMLASGWVVFLSTFQGHLSLGGLLSGDEMGS